MSKRSPPDPGGVRERDRLLDAARRREIDIIAVWRLDRWGRSLSDLMRTFRELQELGVAFVSLTEAFDLTTSTGRAMAAMVAVFAEFEREIRSERVRAGDRAGAARGAPASESLQPVTDLCLATAPLLIMRAP